MSWRRTAAYDFRGTHLPLRTRRERTEWSWAGCAQGRMRAQAEVPAQLPPGTAPQREGQPRGTDGSGFLETRYPGFPEQPSPPLPELSLPGWREGRAQLQEDGGSRGGRGWTGSAEVNDLSFPMPSFLGRPTSCQGGRPPNSVCEFTTVHRWGEERDPGGRPSPLPTL